MHKILTLLMLVMTVTAAYSVNPSKEVTARLSSEMSVFFIHPHKFDVSHGSNIELKEYDITFNNIDRDSVSVTFTYLVNEAKPVKNVTVACADSVWRFQPLRLYLEPDGKKWKGRGRFYLSLVQFNYLTDNNTSPKVTVCCDNECKTEVAYQPRSWNDRRKVWRYALDILKANSDNY